MVRNMDLNQRISKLMKKWGDGIIEQGGTDNREDRKQKWKTRFTNIPYLSASVHHVANLA